MINEAFNEICDKAKRTGCWYVVLWQDVPYYGGAEEGGWWGSDSIPEAYQGFSTEEAAARAEERVKVLAEKMSHERKMQWARQCERELDTCGWDGEEAQARYGETDGDIQYWVSVQDELPEASYGSRHYE